MEVAPAEAPPDLASMTNLSRWYELKFEPTEDGEDLNQAHVWAEQTVDCTPGNNRRRKSTGSIVQEVRPTLRSSTRPVSTFIVGEVTEAVYGGKHCLRRTNLRRQFDCCKFRCAVELERGLN